MTLKGPLEYRCGLCYNMVITRPRRNRKEVIPMFKKKGRLLAGALCVMLAAMLMVPVSAHGCHRGSTRGHHGGYRQSVQTTVTVCPYEDCTYVGRHTHSGVIYFRRVRQQLPGAVPLGGLRDTGPARPRPVHLLRL